MDGWCGVVWCGVVWLFGSDLKPDNVLLKENGELRLADFGEAIVLDGSEQYRLAGSPAYVCALPFAFRLSPFASSLFAFRVLSFEF